MNSTQTPDNHYDKAIVRYEDWQMQCCGKPFSEGEIVEWTADYVGHLWERHNLFLDFEEDHHTHGAYRIKGKVDLIFAEVSIKQYVKADESETGERKVKIIKYDDNVTFLRHMTRVDGWEQPDDLTLWNYIVFLSDVTVEKCGAEQ